MIRKSLNLQKKKPRTLACAGLVSPQKYVGRKTLYETRYPYGPPRGLVKEDGAASKLAIDEANELLLKMYRDKKHREKHRAAYDIVDKISLVPEKR